jgi:hypothetical protein
MEVDAGRDSNAVLGVVGAVGKARVNDIHLNETEIEAVIDVEVQTAAGLEVERGGVAGENAFDGILT